VVLMTTNLGSQAIFDAGGDPSQAEEEIQAALHGHFRPEFLNRLDEVVLFRSLSKEDMKAVARIQLRRVEGLLQAQRLGLEVPEAALDWLAEEGFDPLYGARPLKRTVEQRIEMSIAQAMETTGLSLAKPVLVELQNGLTVATNPEAATPTTTTATAQLTSATEPNPNHSGQNPR